MRLFVNSSVQIHVTDRYGPGGEAERLGRSHHWACRLRGVAFPCWIINGEQAHLTLPPSVDSPHSLRQWTAHTSSVDPARPALHVIRWVTEACIPLDSAEQLHPRWTARRSCTFIGLQSSRTPDGQMIIRTQRSRAHTHSVDRMIIGTVQSSRTHGGPNGPSCRWVGGGRCHSRPGSW